MLLVLSLVVLRPAESRKTAGFRPARLSSRGDLLTAYNGQLFVHGSF